ADAELLRVARALGTDLAIAEPDAPSVGVMVAHDAFHERALAGAVLAEKRVHRSGLDVERHVVERRERPESLAESFDAQELWWCELRSARPEPGLGDHRARPSSAGI